MQIHILAYGWHVGHNVMGKAGQVKGTSTIIGFMENLNSYKIELIENKNSTNALCN
ncbi:MAG: hypothetical protein ACTS73_07525 [Arsenophonus sp. NEOnobi-MAG3]